MRKSKPDQRQMILGRAMEYVKNGTYNNLSIRSFCADIGVTTGIFYRNFPSKEILFHDCCLQLLEEDLNTVDVLLFDLPCEEQLIRFALFLLSFSRKVGQRRILFDVDDPDTIRIYEDGHNMSAMYVRKILSRAAEGHLLDEASIPLALESFFVIVEGIYLASIKLGASSEKQLANEEQLLRRLMPGIFNEPKK